MDYMPQRFVHVGFGNMLCANRIVVILVPGSANMWFADCPQPNACGCKGFPTAGRYPFTKISLHGQRSISGRMSEGRSPK